MKSSIVFPFILAVLSLGYTACSEAEKEEVSAEDSVADESSTSTGDVDGDGQGADNGDCDDTDASIYSGAADTTVDGVDQNCDGVDGMDADADGFVDINGGGDDCDDSNPELTPVDADQDGFSTCADDCDDSDPFTYPGAAFLEFTYTILPITGNNVTTCSAEGNRPLTESECSDYADSMGLTFVQSDGTTTDESGCVEDPASGTITYFVHSQERPCQFPSTCYCFAETLGCMQDQDGDGYGDSTPANDNVLAGTDCDDSEPTVNPGGFDAGTDGLDQNCDGLDEAECENDDSFMDFVGPTAPAMGQGDWFYNIGSITGCDNIFTELRWMGCNTTLRFISYEWWDGNLGDGNDPEFETLSEYCECECPEYEQEPPYCVTLTLTDSAGDGWGNGKVRFDMKDYTLDSGYEISYEVCNFEIDGCTHVSFNKGPNPEDHAWEITRGDYLVGSSANNDHKVGEGCAPYNDSCENCQAEGPNRMYCGQGNINGISHGCGTMGDGFQACTDGRDEVPGGRFTCRPYNYIPPE